MDKDFSSQEQFYLETIDFFFNNADLHFRGLIVPDKTKLNHAGYSQTHDDWYYKMFFSLLKAIIEPSNNYHIYLDYKDTRGNEKITKLREILATAKYDFQRTIIEKIQLIRSHESELMQLTDLLIGALSYVNRELSGNRGKEELIARIIEKSGYSLRKTTLLRENKLNLFVWTPSEENT